MTLTESSRRALSILHPEYPLAPAIFAHYMWPTSESWLKEREAVRGMRRTSGLLLEDLERDCLARRVGEGAADGARYFCGDQGG